MEPAVLVIPHAAAGLVVVAAAVAAVVGAVVAVVAAVVAVVAAVAAVVAANVGGPIGRRRQACLHLRHCGVGVLLMRGVVVVVVVIQGHGAAVALRELPVPVEGAGPFTGGGPWQGGGPCGLLAPRTGVGPCGQLAPSSGGGPVEGGGPVLGGGSGGLPDREVDASAASQPDPHRPVAPQQPVVGVGLLLVVGHVGGRLVGVGAQRLADLLAWEWLVFFFSPV